MAADDPTPDAIEVQRAIEELTDRVPGLSYLPGADGTRKPYASGSLSGAGGESVELLASSHWHHHGVTVRLGAGPFGGWSKPRVPDPDHQEGGLTFVPIQRNAQPDGMLAGYPEAQAALNELWVTSRPENEGERLHGLVIVLRPDSVVAHLRTSAVTADALECLLLHLPAVAAAATAHDDEWRETVHPWRDSIIWPAAWVTLVVVLGILAYVHFFR